uniref:Uncharacterized protein n=1 Tax=Anguilla anguilla TaxID=7936 RepID=A0A0E9WR87_ANGAN
MFVISKLLTCKYRLKLLCMAAIYLSCAMLFITLSLDCDEMQPHAKRNKRHEQLPTALWELEAEGQVKCTVRFKWI